MTAVLISVFDSSQLLFSKTESYNLEGADNMSNRLHSYEWNGKQTLHCHNHMIMNIIVLDQFVCGCPHVISYPSVVIRTFLVTLILGVSMLCLHL